MIKKQREERRGGCLGRENSFSKGQKLQAVFEKHQRGRYVVEKAKRPRRREK